MATWETVHFGDPNTGRHRMQQWVPDSVNAVPKPAYIYCNGRGWHGRHPEIFKTTDPLFLNYIEPAEATKPVAVFVPYQASHTYNWQDNLNPTAWATSTAYSLDDRRKNNSKVYLCVKAHTSSATDEPGVGVNTADYWYEIPKADITQQYWDEYADTPAFRGTGASELQALVQYVYDNAEALGVDRTKIMVAGASAGWQQAGVVAFGQSAPFGATLGPALAAPNATQAPSVPAAALCQIGPGSFLHYPIWSSFNEYLFGDIEEADWLTLSAREKAALSPLDTLQSTGNSVPTFLAYGGNDRWRNEEPPWYDTGSDANGGYHNARNGWVQFRELVDTQAQLGCTYVEDAPSGSGDPSWDEIGRSEFGLNLSPVKDYNPIQPFKNAMKQSRAWFMCESLFSGDFQYDDGSNLYRPDLTADKYPDLNPDTPYSFWSLSPGASYAAATLLFWDLDGK